MTLTKMLKNEYTLTPSQIVLVENYVRLNNDLDDIVYCSEVYDLIDDAIEALEIA
jgi:hypothetical protein